MERPTRPLMVPLLAIFAALVAGCETLPPAKPGAKPVASTAPASDLEIPSAWFVGQETHLLRAEDGDLVLTDAHRDPPQDHRLYLPRADRVAAAYYPRQGCLLAVRADGTAELYAALPPSALASQPATQPTSQLAPATRKPDKIIAPERPSRNLVAHLTIVPGLVYLLNADIAKERELRRGPFDRQDYPEVFVRAVLRPQAQAWQALPAGPRDTPLLEAAYTTAGNTANLHLGTDRQITLRTPEPLAEPFRSGPADPLAQAIWIFPAQIVARTREGWAVHRPDGAPIRWFSTKGIEGGWWTRPTVEAGAIYLQWRNGPGGKRFRLDLPSGELRPADGRD